MPSSSARITRKYRVVVQELQAWTEWPTQEELKAPRSTDSPKMDSTPVDREDWVDTDEIATAKKASLAAYLRGLADELDPPKKGTRGYDA